MKILAVSDLHGNLPYIPKCDLLIVAGDICPDFVARAPQRAWFVDRFVPHIEKFQQTWVDFGNERPKVLATWGNHDWLPKPSKEWSGLTHVDWVKVDELVEVNGLKIWFSPWSNQFGHWAWMDEPHRIGGLYYSQIPEGTDIIVSHQPPYGYGDTPDPRYCIGEGPQHVGSKELLDTINRVKPKVVICGHIHGGFGRYKHLDTTIYNVSFVDEAYRPTNGVTEIIEFED